MSRLTVLSLCLLVSLPASAQRVDEIIAKHIEAKGGQARLQAVQTARITAYTPFGAQPESIRDESVAGSNVAEVLIELKRPNLSRMTWFVPGISKVQSDLASDQSRQALADIGANPETLRLLSSDPRFDISNPAVYMVSGYDGKTLWMWNSSQGKLQVLPSSRASHDFLIEGPLVGYAAKGHKVTLDGKAKAEGKECYRLSVNTNRGELLKVFLDVSTWLEVAIDSKQDGGIPLTARTVYRDWKPVDGVMIAHTTVVTGPGIAQPQPQKITKVEFNVPMEDGSFGVPVVK